MCAVGRAQQTWRRLSRVLSTCELQIESLGALWVSQERREENKDYYNVCMHVFSINFQCICIRLNLWPQTLYLVSFLPCALEPIRSIEWLHDDVFPVGAHHLDARYLRLAGVFVSRKLRISTGMQFLFFLVEQCLGALQDSCWRKISV